MNWLLNAPVWIQTPLVGAVILVICAALAVGWQALGLKLFPASEEERRVHLYTWGDARRDLSVRRDAANPDNPATAEFTDKSGESDDEASL